MRSSWEASATNWRSRSSEADFSAKAVSIWVSIELRAVPSRPTSVDSSSASTRRVRSPEAMAPAVRVIWSRGRSPRRTVHRARMHSAATTAKETSSSMRSSEESVASVGSREMAVISVPWGTVMAWAR